MKKTFLLLAISFIGSLNAQTDFGVKAGYNLSNMKWKVSGFDDYKFDSKSFFYVGGLAEHHVTDKFSIQGELLYTELGGKSKEETLTDIVGNEVVEMGSNTATFTISQIQVPISAKYYVAPKFSLSAGMNFGFNISSKVKQTFNSPMTPSGETENFKTLNLSPFLGTEYQFNKNFFADFRYHFNFINAAKKNHIPTHIGFLQAGLGYRFK